VCIVGAGLGGLAAALDLAAAGAEVTVFEAGPDVGGKAGRATYEGVEFDTGPSVMTLPEVLHGLLDATGTPRDAVPALRPLEPGTRYLFPGGEQLDLGSEPARRRAEVSAALGPAAADDLEAFLDYARQIWDASAPYFVLGDAPTPARLVRLIPVALRNLPRIDALRTMDAALTRRVRDPRLRWLLARFATYNGSDVRRAPATLHCIAHVEIGVGVFGVEGGIHALVRALAARAVALGAELRLDAPVARVLVEGGRARGVALADGTQHAADAVVVNADVAHLVSALLPAPQRRAVRPGSPPSTSGWTAVIRARRRDAAQRPAHAVLLPSNYPDEMADLFDHDRPPVEPTVYLCAQEKAHNRPGWLDHEPLFVMANAPAQPPDGDRPDGTWPRLREVVLGRLRAAGLIDPDDLVAWERTPAELAAQFPGSRGSIYGAASNDMWAAFRRPPNRISGVPGLYLASGGAHPGGGMPLCLLSGRAAARAVLADLPTGLIRR
jgi:phytoene desaturase